MLHRPRSGRFQFRNGSPYEEDDVMRPLLLAVASAASMVILTTRMGFGDDIDDLGELLVKKG
jgi:hypothetical protein